MPDAPAIALRNAVITGYVIRLIAPVIGTEDFEPLATLSQRLGNPDVIEVDITLDCRTGTGPPQVVTAGDPLFLHPFGNLHVGTTNLSPAHARLHGARAHLHVPSFTELRVGPQFHAAHVAVTHTR